MNYYVLCSPYGDSLHVGLCPVGDYSLHMAIEAWPGAWFDLGNMKM